MNTMKLRLLATIITLAAVITVTTPSNAQRRSSTNSTTDTKTESKRSANKSNIEKKGTFRDVAKEPRATNRSVKNKSETRARTENRTIYDSKDRKNNTEKEIGRVAEMPRPSTDYSPDDKRNNETERYNSSRAAATNTSEKYNHNSNDTRYKPNREYKGSDKYWSADYRKENKNNNHHNRNHNYKNYKHWDRSWEGYRWNQNSWSNYYGYYNPMLLQRRIPI